MKIGMAYRVGTGPLMMEVPIMHGNEMYTHTHTVILEGELLNLYSAMLPQDSGVPEEKP